jgi:hypothetical protein
VVVCGQPAFVLICERFVSFMGGRARFVWWVVVVRGSLGWTSQVVSGLAGVVRGRSYSFRVVVGGFVLISLDGGRFVSFMGSRARVVRWVVVDRGFRWGAIVVVPFRVVSW